MKVRNLEFHQDHHSAPIIATWEQREWRWWPPGWIWTKQERRSEQGIAWVRDRGGDWGYLESLWLRRALRARRLWK